MADFLTNFTLAFPLFVLIAVGYSLVRWGRWPKVVSEALARFVFNIALPAMLFRLMSDLSRLPPVDVRLLLVFFGSCLIVFVLGRLIAWRVFSLDGVGQSVFALGGVFSNNVLLGIPLAKTALGEAALPSVALVLVFNALILWTLITVSVEWARHGEFSIKGFGNTTREVVTNPIIAAIVSGSLFGFAGGVLPGFIDTPLGMLSQAAAPLALIALGMSLADYGLRQGWHLGAGICGLKLLVQPAVVWLLAWLIGLPELETAVVVLLASLPVGFNVYLMARQFESLEGPIAAATVISTGLAAMTVPLVLSLFRAATH